MERKIRRTVKGKKEESEESFRLRMLDNTRMLQMEMTH